jgi:Flp pilus assembly pilin Flp
VAHESGRPDLINVILTGSQRDEVLLLVPRKPVFLFGVDVARLKLPKIEARMFREFRGRQMRNLVQSFLRCKSGVTTIEYGLIATMIAAVCILVLTNTGTKLNKKLTSASSGLN